MSKCCAYIEARNLGDLLECYRDFNEFCGDGNLSITASMTAIRKVIDLEYSLERVIETDDDCNEEVINEIHSVIDELGFKLSKDKQLTALLEKHINLLENV